MDLYHREQIPLIGILDNMEELIMNLQEIEQGCLKHCLGVALLAGAMLAAAPCWAKAPPAVATKVPVLAGDSVEIRRDTYGMPHVYAATARGLFYGYGYAVAQDRLFQMEMARRSTQGKVAEVLGPKFLAFDRGIRANYWPQSIHDQIERLPKADRDILDGYAAGFNAWLAKVKTNPDKLMPKQFIDLGFEPEPWTAFDVVMIFVGTMANRFSDFNTEIDNLALLTALKDKHGNETGKRIFDTLKWTVDEEAPTTILERDGRYSVPITPSGTVLSYQLPDYRGVAPAFERLAKGSDGSLLGGLQTNQKSELLAQLETLGMTGQAGWPAASNLWMIGRKRAVGANAILVNGPQFGWFAPAYTYGIGLHGAGFDIVGNTPFGYPCVLFGHNGQIAWGSTAGFGDGVDIFSEKLDAADPSRYLHNNQWLSMEKRTESITVKGAPSDTLDVFRTVHGIVVKTDSAAGVAYAKGRSWAGREVESLLGWVRQGQASNWKSWLSEAERNALTINWYYADRTGNIGYVHTGKYPDRRPGHDRRLPVPGTGEMDWKGFLSFSTNPKVYNPDSGYIANWNNAPIKGYPNPDMLWLSWSSADRHHELEERLASHRRLDASAMWGLLKPTSLADVNVRYFLPLLERATANLASDDRRRQMVDVLSHWNRMNQDENRDGRYDNPSSAIMPAWLGAMLRLTFTDAIPGDFAKYYLGTGYPTAELPPANSMNIQPGVKVLYRQLHAIEQGRAPSHDFLNGKSLEEVAREALSATDAELSKRFGSDITQWLAPVAQNRFLTNNFFGIPQAGEGEGQSTHVAMNRGTENNMTVLSNAAVRSWDVVAPGQSGHISPDGRLDQHYRDQMALYDQFGNKPVLGRRSEILKGTLKVERIKVQP